MFVSHLKQLNMRYFIGLFGIKKCPISSKVCILHILTFDWPVTQSIIALIIELNILQILASLQLKRDAVPVASRKS